jgi:hypothetical protein
MMVILSALMLGAVGAEVFEPTEEIPAQEIARASGKWCPPPKKPDKQHANRLVNWVIVAMAPGSVTSALEPLRMAKKLDPYRETARMALEPWLVETALARLPQTLSPADQRIIVNATRTPHKVRWPEWWSEHP